jgi:hypothetical protein
VLKKRKEKEMTLSLFVRMTLSLLYAFEFDIVYMNIDGDVLLIWSDKIRVQVLFTWG